MAFFILCTMWTYVGNYTIWYVEIDKNQLILMLPFCALYGCIIVRCWFVPIYRAVTEKKFNTGKSHASVSTYKYSMMVAKVKKKKKIKLPVSTDCCDCEISYSVDVVFISVACRLQWRVICCLIIFLTTVFVTMQPTAALWMFMEQQQQHCSGYNPCLLSKSCSIIFL